MPYRDDASNGSVKYRRNYMRHRVVPALAELNPNLMGTFQDTHLRLEGGQQLMEFFSQQWLQEHGYFEGEHTFLLKEALLALPAPLVKFICEAIGQPY